MPIPFPKLQRATAAQLYIGTIIASGFGLLAVLAVLDGPGLIGHLDWCVGLLAVAVVVGEILPVRLGRGEGEMVASTTFAFALLLHAGIGAAALTQAVASSTADRLHGKRPVHWAFNVGQYTLAIFVSGTVFELLTSPPQDGTFTLVQVLAALAAAAVYFVANTGAVSTVIALTSGTRVRDEFSGELMRQTATEGILLGLSPLVVLAVNSSMALVPLLALPLLAVQRAGAHALASRRLALTDALTGLPNRVMFADEARRAIATAERSDSPVVVVIIDLDRFKDINDTLGHSAGDQVLMFTADRLKSHLRDGDVPARLGGDEFAVVLPEATVGDADRLYQRLQKAVSIHPIGDAGQIVFSAGVAGLASDDDAVSFFQKADTALYRAKENGKGRVVGVADAG
jgi:diguanylate cyclase (GGDEF)-like protein